LVRSIGRSLAPKGIGTGPRPISKRRFSCMCLLPTTCRPTIASKPATDALSSGLFCRGGQSESDTGQSLGYAEADRSRRRTAGVRAPLSARARSRMTELWVFPDAPAEGFYRKVPVRAWLRRPSHLPSFSRLRSRAARSFSTRRVFSSSANTTRTRRTKVEASCDRAGLQAGP
jgi:hypothetical protein